MNGSYEFQNGQFIFTKKQEQPNKTCLYDKHTQLAGKSRVVDFAGWLMPLWYSSISQEHNAVRQAAGIFDCTHMGTIKISGNGSFEFLNSITTNNLSKISIGSAQYSYILDAAGNVLDDIIVYYIDRDNWLLVVNAANEDKILTWLNVVNSDNAIIDIADTKRTITYKPQIISLHSQLVDIAIQGPNSAKFLSRVLQDKFENLTPFKWTKSQTTDYNAIISRTGYTGAKLGFEVFLPPEKAEKLWDELLNSCSDIGLLPCGLGARDSLRIEAGLPLYGHELEGEHKINPIEAGYHWAVDFNKPFFVGKQPLLQKSQSSTRKVMKFEFNGAKGIKPIRQDDAVINSEGKCCGYVLSCAGIDGIQKGLAIIYDYKNLQNKEIGVYYTSKRKVNVKVSQETIIDIKGKLI